MPPQVVFPIYKLLPPDPPGTAMMHQRMGFFIAPDGRLLAMAFYGHAPDPFGPGGIGRVVREIHKDGSFGPIYFLRYNTRSGWGESNTGFPYYKASPDDRVRPSLRRISRQPADARAVVGRGAVRGRFLLGPEVARQPGGV